MLVAAFPDAYSRSTMSRLKEMPESEWPRERLEKNGPACLSNSELIAILLRTGTAGFDVLALSNLLVRKYSTLAALSRCSVTELAAIKGIGPAKAVQLAAAFALGNRLAQEQIISEPFHNPALIYEMLAGEMRALATESLRVLLLDTKLHLIRIEEVSHGSINETVASPAAIFKPAIISNAYALILLHNHPSGDPQPSSADHTMTRRLAEGAQMLHLRLLDHIIFGAPAAGRQGYFSFREGGLLI